MNIGCPICHQTFVDVEECVATPCGHLFDKECLAKWMEPHRQRPPKCPTCRQVIGPLIRIYLNTVPEGNSMKKSVLLLKLQAAERDKKCLRSRNFYLDQKYFNLFAKSQEQQYANEQLMKEVNDLKENNEKLKQELEAKEQENTEGKKTMEESTATNKKLEDKIVFIKDQYFQNDELKNKYLSISKHLQLRKDYYKKMAIDYRIEINDLFHENERLKCEIDLLEVHREITNPFCEDSAIAKLENKFLKQAQNEMKYSAVGMDPFLIGKRIASLLQAYTNQFMIDAKIALRNLEPLYKKYGKRSTSFSSNRSGRSGVFKYFNSAPIARSSPRTDLTAASGFDDWPWEI